MITSRAALKLLASAGALAIGASAAAQDASDSAATTPQAEEQSGLNDIIVTARRTEENLERVPVAATVLGDEVLERQQIRRASDLQFNAPSLVVTPDPLGGSSTPVFQLRGQTQAQGSDATVVNYFADVPVDPRVIAAGLFDLSSVQVIRGPQGTLFGKNSTGGAVLMTPRKADTGEIGGFVEGSLGNYDFHQLTGAVNLPLVTDVLALRVSGQIARQDGFAENVSGPDGNDKHWDTGRASLVFTPAGGFENHLLATYYKGSQHLNPYIVKSLGGVSNFFPVTATLLARQQALGNRKFDLLPSISPNNDDNRSYLISNTTSYDFGDVTIKNIFGYWNTHLQLQLEQPSYNFNQVNVSQDRHLHQVSDEFQITGKSFDDSLSWIAGAYYSKYRATIAQQSRLFNSTGAISNSVASLDRYRSQAVFGQATLDLGVAGLDGLKLTGGLRHTWDTRFGKQTPVRPNGIQIKDRQVSWTLGLDYQATDNILLYAVGRHSYKSGGFNLIANSLPSILFVFKPETLTEIELGAKAQFDIGTVPVRTNLALYQGDYKNVHTQATFTCGLLGVGNLIANAGKGTPKGLEFEVEARPFRNLHVSGFYNRTLGTYDQFVIPSVPGCTLSSVNNLTGQIFGNINKNTAGLTADYTVPLGDADEELVLTGNLYTRSRRPGNDLKGFNSPLPGYTLLNFRVDYEHIAGSRLSVGAYVRNLTNKLFELTHQDVRAVAGYEVVQYGDPRTYGLEAKFEF